jgi:glutamate decarboxylase
MLTEFQREEDKCEQDEARGTGSALDTIGPIYASRFMENPVPKYRMPDDEMPAAIASRIIRDEMELDGIPGLNLATFVNTYIEPEAEELAAMQLTKNAIDVDEYPRTAEIQSRCVQILGDLFNTPFGEKACGVPTLGSSEGCLLGGLAMKLNWRKERRSKGLSSSRPNVVVANSAQVVWKKFLLTCDVEPHWVPLTPTSYVMDVEEAIKQVDENTIGVVMLFASTLTGPFSHPLNPSQASVSTRVALLFSLL